jgi:ATP phosphoribosyltransferase regulatory subunit HisZ
MTETQVALLTNDLFHGNRIEKAGYCVLVTFNKGASNINSMLAAVGRLDTGKAIFHGDVEDAAREFLRLVEIAKVAAADMGAELPEETITLEGCPAGEDSWEFAARAVETGRLPRTPDRIDHDAPFVHCHFA